MRQENFDSESPSTIDHKIPWVGKILCHYSKSALIVHVFQQNEMFLFYQESFYKIVFNYFGHYFYNFILFNQT